MPNIVNITVTSTNRTQPGINEARGGLGALKAAAIEAAAAIAAALVDIAVKSAKMATEFDAQMTRLTTQAGVASNQIGTLSRGVLDLAGSVAQSPQSLAEALFHVESNFASLGISSQKALSLVKIAAEGATVGNANLVDVTNALTAAVASGIPGVQDFSKAMGILNATVGAGDMTMQDLANALSSGVLAVVKGYGLSITDVSAALATFGDNNIRGKVAATDLRVAVQALAVPAKTGAAILDSWGVKANQLAVDMQQHGLLFALEHLQQLFKDNGVTAVQQGDIITQMFGKKAGSGVAILLGQMDRLKSKYPDLTKGANSFADAWQKTTQTMAFRWAAFTDFMKARMIDFGNWLIPQLDSMVNSITRLWQGTPGTPSRKFTAHGPGQSGATPEMTVATPEKLGLSQAWNKFYESFKLVWSKVSEILDKFAKSMWAPMIQLIVDDLKKWADEIKKDWPNLKPIFVALALAIGLVITALLAMIDLWVRIQGFFVKLESMLGAAIKFIVDGAAKAFGWIPGLGPQLKKAASDFDRFVAGVNSQIKSIPRTVTVTVQTVNNLAGTYNQQVPYAARHAIGGIASGLTMVGERGTELLNLPPGTHVTPSGSVGGSLAAAGAGGSGRLESVFRFEGGTDGAFASLFMNLLRSGKIVIRQRYITV